MLTLTTRMFFIALDVLALDFPDVLDVLDILDVLDVSDVLDVLDVSDVLDVPEQYTFFAPY
ncbi:hypothetical protein FRC12_005759 [Ceratobasidium sp. 428]|nr:hypothetical protein FRC12_005759 [Ceratobasidium sp. 428]